MTFTGKLLQEGEGGKPLADKIIKIFDVDVGRDDLLATGTTQADGSFAIQWVARKTDAFDNTAEIRAKFDGDDDNRCSVSKQHVVTVETKK